MSYLPFWLSGLALAAVPIVHWFVLRRSLAVSGRYSAVVDRLRWGTPEEPVANMSQEDLLAAMRALTADEFGEGALEGAAGEPASVSMRPEASAVPAPAPAKTADHLLFFGGVTLGGALSWYLAGGEAPVLALRSEFLYALVGESPWIAGIVLFVGCMLVGAGTRMAGGCTTGHGLCGLSRLQVGSLVATASFFGAGVAVSFLLGAFL